jgi:GT2 family glycosyltransferase
VRLLVVILNYRTPELTIQCLRSLAGEVVAELDHVVVVDGGSDDDSTARIGSAFETEGWSWVSLMALETNRGYAAGNNAAIRAALASPDPPRYVLVLNPDTRVRKGAIEALVKFMDRHPRAGIAGCRLENSDGTPQTSAFRFPSVISEFEGSLRFGPISRSLSRWRVPLAPSADTHQSDWVAGASFIIRNEVLTSVGLMDEGYFLYYEELDFCRRAKLANWECWHIPQSRVVHLIGQSTGVSRIDRRPARRPPYWFESRRRYFQKHHGRFYAAVADGVWMLGFTLWQLRQIGQRKRPNDPPYLLWDFFWQSSLIHSARSK